MSNEALLKKIEAATAPERHFRISPTDLAGTIEPTRYVVEKILPRKHLTLLGGHGGSGKSLLSCVIAAHCATGRECVGLPVIQCRTLLVSLEDPADVVRLRLRRIVEAYQLDAQAVEAGITIADGSNGAVLAFEASEAGQRRLCLTAAHEELREIAAGYGLIIIDNASDAFDADENNRRMVRAFVRSLAAIAREQDAAVMLLAHIDKNAARFGSAGNSYSGSTAWHNSARSRLALVEADGRLELRHEKANHGPKAETITLEWTSGGVLVPADSSNLSDRDAEDDEAVFAAIRAAVEVSTDVTTARTGPATTQRVLETYPDLPAHLRGKAGRTRFWTAVTRLERRQEITREPYRDRNRNQKERWIVSACVNPHTPMRTNAAQGRVSPAIGVGSGSQRRTYEPTHKGSDSAAVSCGTCRHFERTDHPHMGTCDAGEPAPGAAGFWDTDPRTCDRWEPTP